MNTRSVATIMNLLSSRYGETEMVQTFRQPYQLLVAVMLSARSRDSMTIPVAKELFAKAPTAEHMIQLSRKTVERILRPIGFFRVKAGYVQALSQRLLSAYQGAVPRSFDDLISLPGVSRKTAHVVMSQLFHEPVIAVDTHVHRITHRLGWVDTHTPQETELALMSVVPQSLWHDVNRVFVQHGQTTCLPRSPRCIECPISAHCPKIGVI